jgi:hypothetical protein
MTRVPSIPMTTLLAPLRRAADRIGEGGILIAGLILVLSLSMTDVRPGHQATNAFWLSLMLLVALCIMARSMDSRGHAAVRKLDRKAGKKASQDPKADFLAQGLEWLGLPAGSDAAAIKAGVRTMMLKHHSDTGTGNLDMDDLVTFRDRMLDVVATCAATPDEPRIKPPSTAKRLKAYEEAAGPLGRAWGRLLPSPLLKELGRR